MDLKAEIKDRIDIIELTEELTGHPATPVGRWFDIEECPFCHGHDCFRIPEHRRWAICYQCGPKSYDVFALWQGVKHVNFTQALKDLAKKAGLAIPKKRAIQAARMVELFSTAAEMFKNALRYGSVKVQHRKGEKLEEMVALDYILQVRKRTLTIIEKWCIGVTYEGYIEDLKAAGFTIEEIEACQLAYRGIDSFGSGLISFPCFLESGEISHIRFKDPSKSKRETQIRKTKRSPKFYVYNQRALDERQLVITEGENDCISVVEAGMPALATLSGPNKDMIKWLQKEYGDRRFFLAFDNDEAGKNYLRRFMALWRGAPIKLLVWPEEEKDIDGYLRDQTNPEEILTRLVKESVHPREELHAVGAVFENEVGFYAYRGDNLIQLTNFKIDIKGIEVDPDTKIQEWIVDLFSASETVKNIPFSALSFASAKDFKKTAGSYGTFLYFGSDRELQELVGVIRLKHQNVPKITLIRQIGYLEEFEGWFAGDLLVGQDGSIKKGRDGIVFTSEKHGLILVPPSSAPRFSQEVHGVTSEKECKDLAERFLYLLSKNIKRGSLVAFGWSIASLFAEQFSKKENWFPILWLGGQYQAGKNILAQIVRLCLGLPIKPETMSESYGGVTEVALMRNLEFFSNLPVWVDEVTNQALQTKFTSIFKDIYMRAVASKGTRQAHRLRSDVVRGTLMVTAEEFPQDAGLRSRCLPILLAEKFRDDKYWPEISGMQKKLPLIGSHVILNFGKKFGEFMKNYEDFVGVYYTNKSDLRLQKNVCVALAGLSLVTSKKTMDIGIQQAEWLLERESHPIVAADRKVADNFFRWLMQGIHDQDVSSSVLRQTSDKLVKLHFYKAYNDLYDKKMSFRREFPNPRRLMLCLEAQNHFIRKEKQWTDTVHKPYLWVFKPEGILQTFQETLDFSEQEAPPEEESPF